MTIRADALSKFLHSATGSGAINRGAMALSIALRMVSGLIAFILIARELGPKQYGLFAGVFAWSTFASLVTDFGFASKALRDISANPKDGAEILSGALNVKIYLTLLVFFVGVIFITLCNFAAPEVSAACILGSAVLLGAIGDLAFTAYRGMGRFKSEAKITAVTSALHVIIVGLACLLKGSINVICLAYLVSRVGYAVYSVGMARNLFGKGNIRILALKDVLERIWGAWSWASDNTLGYLNVQIDSLMVASLFGLTAAGMYQAGNRFLQAGFNVNVALANVHVPVISRMSSTGGKITSTEVGILFEFLVVALIGMIILILGGPLIAKYVIGKQYGAVNRLWVGFAIFFGARTLAAAFGVALVGHGASKTRVGGQLGGLLVTALGLFVCYRLGRIDLVPYSMAIGAFATLIFYFGGRLSLMRRP